MHLRHLASFPFVALVLAGCAASADAELTTQENELVTVTRLDALAPRDVAEASTALFGARLDALETHHPDVDRLSSSTLGAFVEYREVSQPASGPRHVTVRVDHMVAETIRELFTFTEKDELSLDEIASTFPAWVEAQLPSITTASGKASCRLARGILATACNEQGRVQAVETARAPAGIDLPALYDAWKAAHAGSQGAFFIAPVKVSGEPTFADVRAIAGAEGLRQRSWGHEAVDDVVAGERFAAPFAGALHGPGIKKRWYFAAGGDSWGEARFIVLDEHDQMWGFGSSASE